MRYALALAFTLLAAPALAQDPMTGAEFEAYVEGRTLSFGAAGTPNFGIEMYLPNRRVIWSGSPGECTDGVWYDSKGSICFRYENDPEPKCWEVYDESDGIRAVYTTNPNTTVLFEKVDDVDPLICGDLSS